MFGVGLPAGSEDGPKQNAGQFRSCGPAPLAVAERERLSRYRRRVGRPVSTIFYKGVFINLGDLSQRPGETGRDRLAHWYARPPVPLASGSRSIAMCLTAADHAA